MKLGSLLSSALVAGLVFACGGGGSSGYPTSTGNSGGTGTTGGPAPGNVSIVEYSYTPDTITIKAGATVTWTNDGTMAHTATADGGAFDSGQLSAPGGGGGYGYGGGTGAGSFSFTFTQAGTFDYHCTNHPTLLKGTVIVTP